MKVLIISDIHGNYYALKAVVENTRFDMIICCGDLICGYPLPQECVDVIKIICSYICMGNHDYAVAYNKKPFDNVPPQYIKYAKIFDWARDVARESLCEEAIEYLRVIPREKKFLVDGTTFYLNHTVPNLSHNYHLDLECPQSEIENHYKDIHADILITGHTHVPYIKKLKNRVLINPGSVGASWDGDPRASFAVFDTRTGQIELCRFEYDITKTSSLLKKLNFPKYLLFSLQTGLLPDDPDVAL